MHALRTRLRRAVTTPTDARFVDLGEAAAVVERILVENIIPFWSDVIDDDHGGFRLHHDQAGRWCGPAPRHLVTQARTTWHFARLARSRWGTPDDLEAAKHGATFLRTALHDERHGGYHWTVEATSHRPIERAKVVYGQAFALFAFSELAAAGDADAAVAATELFELLERHAHDERHGGYIEFLADDWSPPPAEARSPMASIRTGLKTRNTHLHVLEAYSAYGRSVGGDAVTEQLRELVVALTVAFRSPTSGTLIERRTASWDEPGAWNDEVVSYGHDLEGVWLLDDAVRQIGDRPEMLLAHHRHVFDRALRYGVERRRGGVSYSGRPDVMAGRRDRSWWVQAEALVACLAMARLTGDERYVDVFAAILGWVVDHQVDWEGGEWFEWVSPTGRPSGVKAGPWKGPYHSGRSMLECLERIEALRS